MNKISVVCNVAYYGVLITYVLVMTMAIFGVVS